MNAQISEQEMEQEIQRVDAPPISRLSVSFKRFKVFSKHTKSMLIVHINQQVIQFLRNCQENLQVWN